MIRRREFIAGLGSAAAWPVVAQAQQAAVPVVGFVSTQSADDSKFLTIPFLQGLKETGMSRAKTLCLNTVGRRGNTIDCPRLQPISSAAA